MKEKIAFIGAGNMARCLISGLIDSGYPAENISAAAPEEAHIAKLRDLFQITVSKNNKEIVTTSDIIVLAVKPNVIQTVVHEIKDLVHADKHLVISIAAGIPCTALGKWLNDNIPIVRCMPNTAAAVHCGATGLFAGPHVSENQKHLAKTILDTVGISLWFENEDLIDSVTALSGSGPAYFFLMMESMIKAGVGLGLSEEAASQLTIQTALGAAKLATSAHLPPNMLREQVTSPGGTTEAALKTLADGKFSAIIENAITAAKERAKLLASEGD